MSWFFCISLWLWFHGFSLFIWWILEVWISWFLMWISIWLLLTGKQSCCYMDCSLASSIHMTEEKSCCHGIMDTNYLHGIHIPIFLALMICSGVVSINNRRSEILKVLFEEIRVLVLALKCLRMYNVCCIQSLPPFSSI